MKRKFADRPNWKRVISRTTVSEELDGEEFQGHAVLIYIDKIKDALWVELGGKKQCVADTGYCWLTLFQKGESYVVTAMFDNKGQIVQWYIDICKAIGFTDRGVPWYDDLYLDIIISSDYDVALIDEDDLALALKQSVIKQEDYDFAYQEADKLLKLLEGKQFKLLGCSKRIYDDLIKKIHKDKQ